MNQFEGAPQMKQIVLATFSCVFAILSTPALAQMFANPNHVSAAKETAVGGGYTSSKITYKDDEGEAEAIRIQCSAGGGSADVGCARCA